MSKSYYYMKKEFEKDNCKILYPPMIIHKDRKGDNIIQPIPFCEKQIDILNVIFLFFL